MATQSARPASGQRTPKFDLAVLEPLERWGIAIRKNRSAQASLKRLTDASACQPTELQSARQIANNAAKELASAERDFKAALVASVAAEDA